MHDSGWNHTEAATALLDEEVISRHVPEQKRALRWGLFASCLSNVVLLAALLYLIPKTHRLSASTNIYCRVTMHAFPNAFSNPRIAPAHSAIQYKTKTFFPDFPKQSSEYQGWPSDHQDALWEELHSSRRPKLSVHRESTNKTQRGSNYPNKRGRERFALQPVDTRPNGWF